MRSTYIRRCPICDRHPVECDCSTCEECDDPVTAPGLCDRCIADERLTA